jgi:hypothetical protein
MESSERLTKMEQTEQYVQVSLTELQRMSPEERQRYRAMEDAYLRRQEVERHEDRQRAVQLVQDLHGLSWPRAKAILTLAQAFLEETLLIDLARAESQLVRRRFVGPSTQNCG